MPEDNGLTALDSQRASNIANSAILNADRSGTALSAPQLNNTSLLADQLGESRIELSTGGTADIGQTALLLAQGGQIAIAGGSRVTVETGANLDVSGTTNAVLPASVNDLLVNVQPFQLRDSAGNRTGNLKGTNVYVDAATLVQIASGAYGGNIYTPGGLIEVAGYLGLVPHGIAEWTAIGGQVTLQASQIQTDPNTGKTSTVSGAVITQPGSVIDLAGGSVSYQAGAVQQSYVQAADGQVFNVNTAPGNLVYTGLYDGSVVNHPRWHVTDTYTNKLLTPATIDQVGYTVGRDAGSITIAAATDVIQGSIEAGVTLGQFQNGPRPTTVTDPYLLAQTVVAQAGTLSLGNYVSGVLQAVTTPTQIVFQATQGPAATIAPPTGSATGTIAAPVFDTAIIDAPLLDADGFSTILASTRGTITVAAPIGVADGGAISLAGATIAVDATITARSGAITLADQLVTTNGAVTTSLPLGVNSAVTLAAGATLDARGVWTNAVLDPAHLAGLGHVNGGTVTIAGSNGVTLAAGSTIDVSSGGAQLAGRQVTGRGGSVTVVADQPLVPAPGAGNLQFAPVSLDSRFVGYGSAGGGTLSLTAPEFRIGGAAPGAGITSAGPFLTVVLDPALFSSGFARYAIDGVDQLSVAPGTQVSVAEPIYEPASGLAVPTGNDPSQAYIVALPQLYLPTRTADMLAERAGASIALLSSVGPAAPVIGDGGPVTIGVGASVAVDPGQSIQVAGYGQVSVLGTLTAHGGSVQVANTSYGMDNVNNTSSSPPLSQFQAGVSVWLGGQSRIDVSGQAMVQTDPSGRRFGLASAGGTIQLGSFTPATTTFAQVIERPGAVLDADGAQASVDVVPGLLGATLRTGLPPVTLVSNGGTIAADSIDGIALDGTATARAGGAGASGGALSLTLDPINFGAFSAIPTYVYQPRLISVTQNAVPVQADPGLQPGAVPAAATYGLAAISQQQIDAGGFDALTLSAQGAEIVAAGAVSLHTARSITLGAGVIGSATAAPGTFSIAAPVVSLLGETQDTEADTTLGQPVAYSAAVLSVNADLISAGNTLYLGGSQTIAGPSNTGTSTTGTPTTGTATMLGPPAAGVSTFSYGFAEAEFVSTGDIRFLGSQDPTGGELLSAGDLGFKAGQLSPATGASTQIIAGINPAPASVAPRSAGGTITITGNGPAPQPPVSVGGTLQFVAQDIIQAGTVRAPEGTLVFSDGSQANSSIYYPSQVTFVAGSTTSVSLAGQTIPYGGTVDGVTYLAPGGGTPAVLQPMITVQSQSIIAQDGASIDLRGGGTLSGAGFVFGRGGSVDVLTTPLLDVTGGALLANPAAQVAALQPQRTGDAVYAILPGYTASYAPAASPGDAAYTATTPGERITIGNTVPGLAAGTYTLLPAYDALLPGGYRVELTSGVLAAGTSLPQGNFTSITPVTVSIANTQVAGAVPTDALITSGANVRQLSQYDEESYNSFEAAAATQFGAPRPFLPQDAKTLALLYPDQAGTLTALTLPAAALLKTPDTGGYGATIEIDSQLPIVVTGPGDVAPAGSLAFAAATLDALDAPRLVLGGTLSVNIAASDTININALAASVDIMPHAVLTAGDILITTNQTGLITVEPGGTISTIGAGPAAYDATNGYFFNNQYTTGKAYPVLEISNGQLAFIPNTDASSGAAISIGAGSGALAGGSLDVVAPNDTAVTIGAANLGAKFAAIAVAAINVGSQQSLDDLTAQLPAGLSLTPQALTGLLTGNAALGTPAATVLTLTATQEVNLLGSVSLDTGATDLVLNTPAIYGVGFGRDAASITAANFTWSGVPTTAYLALDSTAGIAASALPGGQIQNGLGGHPVGALSITAGTITLGYGPQTQPNDQVVLDRLIAGFSNVTLTGTAEITANNQSALSVFANQTTYGQPGTGGNLTLASPLITTQSAAVLQLTAGGALSLTRPNGAVSPSTAGVASLGGEIDAKAASVLLDTAVALPSGQLNVTAQTAIDVTPDGVLDLSGRAVHFFDQTAYAPGGTLAFESASGSITLATGSVLDVAATNAAAGSLSFNALAGEVALDGTLVGSAGAGQTGGSLTVVAGTLATTTQAANVASGQGALANINAGLNAGGFTANRSFELGTDIGPGGAATTNVVIGNDSAGHALLAASAISVTADLGSIDVVGTINASGAGPGNITLAALQNLTLETTAVLDAHATQTAADSYGQPIDAENRAHVTLTSTAGSLLLNGGTINLSYPGQAGSGVGTDTGTPQGQLVLNAPRLGTNDVAITASAPIAITGEQSIALYAWRSYQVRDANGTVVQDASTAALLGTPVVSLDAIDSQSAHFIEAAGTNTALAARLAGLSTYGTLGSLFHLRPGVAIDSNAGSSGNITIAGDLNLSGFRYSDTGYGLSQTAGLAGSGEPGALLFRAANNLVVNGSVTDGFAAPPDSKPGLGLSADHGWVVLAPSAVSGSGAPDPLSADVILPSSITVSSTAKGVTTTIHKIELVAGTTFDESRPISLNYDITIQSANIAPNEVIPFSATVADDGTGNGTGVVIPQGGFVTTAAITTPTGNTIHAGTYLPGGFDIAIGSVFAPGSVFPVMVQVARNTVVPAGTLLDIFDDGTLTLSRRTGALPVDALIPANTVAQFAQPDGTLVYRLQLRPERAGCKRLGAGLPLRALGAAAGRFAIVEPGFRGRRKPGQRRYQRGFAALGAHWRRAGGAGEHRQPAAWQPDPGRPALSDRLGEPQRRQPGLQRYTHRHRQPLAGGGRRFRPELALRHLHRRHAGPAGRRRRRERRLRPGARGLERQQLRHPRRPWHHDQQDHQSHLSGQLSRWWRRCAGCGSG